MRGKTKSEELVSIYTVFEITGDDTTEAVISFLSMKYKTIMMKRFFKYTV